MTGVEGKVQEKGFEEVGMLLGKVGVRRIQVEGVEGRLQVKAVGRPLKKVGLGRLQMTEEREGLDTVHK